MPLENKATNLEKACDLLLLLTREDTALPVAELSQRLGISRTTAYAMLESLQSRGFVERNEEGRFTAGFALLRAADGYQRLYPFVPVAEPHMRTLAEQWKQSVMLSVYKSPCYLVMLRMVSGRPDMEASQVSGVMNALRTAGGRLLMAQLPDETIRQDLLQGPSPMLLPEYPYDPEEVHQQILALRNASYEIERNEYAAGRGSIAVPIYNRQGKVIAALTGPVDLSRTDPETLQRMIADFTSAGLRISAKLGYPVVI